MKKTYIQPQMEAHRMEVEVPLALSTFGTNATDNEVLSKGRSAYDDDDDLFDDGNSSWLSF